MTQRVCPRHWCPCTQPCYIHCVTKSDFVYYSVFWTLFCQTSYLYEIHFSAGFQAIPWLTKYSFPFRYYSWMFVGLRISYVPMRATCLAHLRLNWSSVCYAVGTQELQRDIHKISGFFFVLITKFSRNHHPNPSLVLVTKDRVSEPWPPVVWMGQRGV